jgi:guanylate kinase
MLRTRIRDMVWSVSATTRPQRPKEEDGKDYFFLSEEQFCQKIAAGDFLEYAQVHGCYYGTPKKLVDDAIANGRHCFLEIDVQGARTIRESRHYNLLQIFIAPPDVQELKRRLVARASDNPQVVERRLQNALRELQEMEYYDYRVVNSDIEEATTAVEVILSKELFGEQYVGTI